MLGVGLRQSSLNNTCLKDIKLCVEILSMITRLIVCIIEGGEDLYDHLSRKEYH